MPKTDNKGGKEMNYLQLASSSVVFGVIVLMCSMISCLIRVTIQLDK